MERLRTQIKPVVNLWETIEKYEEKIEFWRRSPLQNLDVNEMDETCNEWIKKLTFCKKNQLLQTLKGPMSFCEYINRSVENIYKFLPLLLLLKGRGMMQSHLNLINKEFPEIVPLEMKSTTLSQLQRQDLHLEPKIEFVRIIADSA